MKKKFAFIISILAYIGVLIAMSGTAIDSLQYPFLSAIGTIRFFTIQSNIIIGTSFLLYSLSDKEKYKILLGGSIVYIVITFLGFAIMLERIWDPTGVSLIGSLFNHYIIPLISLLYIVSYRHEFTFTYTNILKWIIYPLVYLVFYIIYGSITSDYFYPFLDLSNMSILIFILVILFIICIFTILSVLLILITKKRKASI